jgi:hypothetical protein
LNSRKSSGTSQFDLPREISRTIDPAIGRVSLEKMTARKERYVCRRKELKGEGLVQLPDDQVNAPPPLRLHKRKQEADLARNQR